MGRTSDHHVLNRGLEYRYCPWSHLTSNYSCIDSTEYGQQITRWYVFGNSCLFFRPWRNAAYLRFMVKITNRKCYDSCLSIMFGTQLSERDLIVWNRWGFSVRKVKGVNTPNPQLRHPRCRCKLSLLVCPWNHCSENGAIWGDQVIGCRAYRLPPMSR